jgi:hypothetical protein
MHRLKRIKRPIRLTIKSHKLIIPLVINQQGETVIMTKEQLHAKPKMADTRQEGQVGSGDGDMADTAGVQSGAKRIPVKIEQEDEEEGQYGGDTDDAKSPRQPEAERTDGKVRRNGRAKLSPQAVAHLRGRILKGASSVGFIDDPAAQNPAMESYNHGYELGYADGYTKAEEDFDNAYRLHVEKSTGITAKQFNGWQILGIAAPALLIGVVMGIIL